MMDIGHMLVLSSSLQIKRSLSMHLIRDAPNVAASRSLCYLLQSCSENVHMNAHIYVIPNVSAVTQWYQYVLMIGN